MNERTNDFWMDAIHSPSLSSPTQKSSHRTTLPAACSARNAALRCTPEVDDASARLSAPPTLHTLLIFAHSHQVIQHDLPVLAPSDHIRVRVVENTLDFVLLGPMRLVPTCQSAITLTRSKAAQSFALILLRYWMSCWQRSTGRREKQRQN